MSRDVHENNTELDAFEPGAPMHLSVRQLLLWIVHDQAPWGASRKLTLPPLQRNGVWRPRQVLDLWRSVLEGMPIGLFYLTAPKTKVILLSDTKELASPPLGAVDLFDGQQRVRALALGAEDRFNEGRCIWVRFHDTGYELVLSSRTQPAGYKLDGTRLSVADRREWYNLSTARPEAEKQRRYPDYPAGCSADNTARLATLLELDVNAQAHGHGRPSKTKDSAWDVFQKDVGNLTRASAIFVRLPEHITSNVERTLELFRRIGAGGTPLSEAEQIYSAYKARKPEIRTVVEEVHQTVSFLLTPVQIVQAALRMANTLADQNTGWPPGFNVAMTAFSSSIKDAELEPWVQKLNGLLTGSGEHRTLEQAFENVKTLLLAPGHDAYSLPEVVVAQLPSELWQVLAFWCLRGDRDPVGNREEVVRFAMAWHLAVTHQERAAQICFRILAIKPPSVFPGRLLFRELIANTNTAMGIPQPGILAKMFATPREDLARWLTSKQRFPEGAEHSNIAATWWFSRKMLPWLQRVYVIRQFNSYKPLSDHEDDLPYDFDHICPRAHWGPNGRKGGWKEMGFKDENERRAVMPEPWMVGDSLGNMRLVDFSQNREDGDKAILEKMPFLTNQDEDSDAGKASDFLMDNQGETVLWERVSNSANSWNNAARRAAFQEVVGLRTTRLYAEFYNTLGFEQWEEIGV